MYNWGKLGIDVSRIRKEGKTICPKCTPTRKNKRDKSLSANVITGDYNCHNSPCDFRGNAGDDFLDRARPKKEYAKPAPRLQRVDDKILKWFEGRSISNNTLLQARITFEPDQWMPQDEQKHRAICFNYYRNGELVNIKFRTAEKFFTMSKDAELIFYNLDCLAVPEGRKFVIIVEGELDCLTWIECGIYSAISVPNGASKGVAPKLDYLDNCWHELAEVPIIILAVDNDEPGELLKQELIRRLGPERCFIVQYPDGCKDSNEVLMKFGKDTVLSLIKSENLKAIPLDGVQTMEDMEDEADYIYNFGYPVTQKLGWELDKHITWLPGDITVITGIPNHGKSTWINNVIVELGHLHKWRIAVFSPEKNRSAFIVAELASILIGLPTYRKDANEKMNKEEWNRAKDFIHEHFLFIKTSGIDTTLDGLLDIGHRMVKRYGINGYLIDPWNYVETDIPAGQTETVWLGNQLSKAGEFGKSTNVHVWFVAHPTKMEKDKKTHKYLVPTLYNISGSSNWNNKIDNGICVYRNYDDGTTTIYIQKVRWFFVGKAGGSVKMVYDPNSQRFRDAPPELSPEQAT
jgi:twinkle protein